MKKLLQEDLDFLRERSQERKTVSVGYVMNLDRPILERYETIYRNYLDNTFILTYWCDSCVYKMISRIFEQLSDQINAPAPQIMTEEKRVINGTNNPTIDPKNDKTKNAKGKPEEPKSN